MASLTYCNPEGIPEHAIKDKRTILVHFKNKEDLIEFNKRTGIQVNEKNRKISWPLNDALGDMFE